ncbi:MAG: formate dehydrogenase accessory protein FdhE [Syntrophomonadaceae bacterium]|jgi:FdhE protein
MQTKIPVQLPSGYLEFFSSLESWQNEQQIKLQAVTSFAKTDALRQLAKHRRPLVSINGLSIDPIQYQEVLSNLLDFMSEQRPDIVATVDVIRSNAPHFDYPLLLSRLIDQDLAFFQEMAHTLNISAELLIFVLDHAIRPFIRLYAAQFQSELLENTFQNWHLPAICPVCGSRSHFSRLRAEDGRRFMFCDRCFTEWETRYLECIHCGMDEPGQINYISIENDESHQLYTCDKCKGYLKTYDERPTGRPTDLFIANIRTVYLDLLAEERGYSNHSDDWPVE